MSAINKKWVLKNRPTGLVKESNFEFIKESIPELNEGDILIQTEYLSMDPTQRMWLTEIPGYLPPVQIDEVIRSSGMGRIIQSKNKNFNEGSLVSGLVGWQTHLVSNGKGFRVIPELLPIPTLLNVLGLTGITAYFGLLNIGKPKEDETVVVSGASGATGSVVAQIAKIKGCNVIGIAGGEEKCSWLADCGIDHVIDYKNTEATKELRKIANNGIDIYFDNVGGPLLEAVLYQINQKARIVICGAIANYTSDKAPVGPKNLSSLIINRAKMEGFLVLDYFDRIDEAIQGLSKWLMEGKIKHREDIQIGIENCPETLNRLFTGANKGKQLLKI